MKDIFSIGVKSKEDIVRYIDGLIVDARQSGLVGNDSCLSWQDKRDQYKNILLAAEKKSEPGFTYHDSVGPNDALNFIRQVEEVKSQYKPILPNFVPPQLRKQYENLMEIQKPFPELLAFVLPTFYGGRGKVAALSYFGAIGKLQSALRAENVKEAEECIARIAEKKAVISKLTDVDKVKVLREKAGTLTDQTWCLFFACDALRSVAHIVFWLCGSLQCEPEASFQLCFDDLPKYSLEILLAPGNDKGLTLISEITAQIGRIASSLDDPEKNLVANNELRSSLDRISEIAKTVDIDLSNPMRSSIIVQVKDAFFDTLTMRAVEVPQEVFKMWLFNCRNFIRDFNGIADSDLKRRAEEMKAFSNFALR